MVLVPPGVASSCLLIAAAGASWPSMTAALYRCLLETVVTHCGLLLQLMGAAGTRGHWVESHALLHRSSQELASAGEDVVKLMPLRLINAHIQHFNLSAGACRRRGY